MAYRLRQPFRTHTAGETLPTAFYTRSAAAPSFPIKASSNGRYLTYQDGTPFLMVGDSPQSLIANVGTAAAASYFADRQAQGFNTLWINALCTSYTYGNSSGTTFDGLKPFSGSGVNSFDLATPSTSYFQRVDQIVSLAGTYGQVVLLDPIETGGFLTCLTANGNTKAFNYGTYMGNRYKNQTNVIWLHGNDFQSWNDGSGDAPAVRSVMDGIASVDTNHLQTIELSYPLSMSVNSGTCGPACTLNAAYTYYPTYAEVTAGYNSSTVLPVFMVEANYDGEDNFSNDPSTPLRQRLQEYWTVLGGGLAGHIYGNYFTVRTTAASTAWSSAANIDTTSVTHLAYMKNLFTSVAYQNLVPDQSHTFCTAGYGNFDNGTDPVSASTYTTAALTPDGSLGMLYMPTSRTVTIDMTKITGGSVHAQWFDPTANTYATVSGQPFANSGTHTFTPTGNNAAGDPDWLLMLTKQ